MRPPRSSPTVLFYMLTAVAALAPIGVAAAQAAEPPVDPAADEAPPPADTPDDGALVPAELAPDDTLAPADVPEPPRDEPAPVETPEEDELPFTFRPLASLFSRAEVREGYEGIGAANPGCFPGVNDGACMRYRARVGLAIEDLHISDALVAGIRFQPQATGYWSLGGSGGVTHPSLGLYEGNLTLQIGSAVTVQAGRLVLNYGDEMVIGQLGWHPAARSFDGARLRIQPEDDGIWVDAFWTLVQEGGPGSFGVNDVYFYGLYAALGPLVGADTALDAYVFGLQSNESTDPVTAVTTDWSLLVHIGARVRHRVSLVDFRVEGGLQVGRVGRPTPADASQLLAGHVDGEVGVNLLSDRLRIGAHGFYASGDDPATPEMEGYAQLFPTAHAFLGLSDVMGARTNVAGGALHVLGKPIDQLRIALDLHTFTRPEAAADHYAGLESDVHLIWLPGAGFKVRAMYGLFVPNEGFWGSSEAVHYLEVEVGYQLK